MVLAQLWLTGRSEKGDLLPIAAQRKRLLFGFPLWQPQNVSRPTAKAVLSTSSRESKILLSLMSSELHAPSLFAIPIRRALNSHEFTFTKRRNGEGRQKEIKCLTQHHTGNLRPSSSPSSSPALQSQPGPRSQQTWGRENPYEKKITRHGFRHTPRLPH